MVKTTKNYDLRKILKPFENQWVALTSDNSKVVASGKTLSEASKKVEGKDVVFMRVLPLNASFAPFTV